MLCEGLDELGVAVALIDGRVGREEVEVVFPWGGALTFAAAGI